MATNPVSIQDYIDKYLADKASLKPKSYQEYIMHGGKGAAIVASDRKLSAENNYSRSLSSYGKHAETLAEGGLLGSGYANYINKAAEQKRKNELDMALGGALSIAAQNKASYSEYIEKIAEQSKKEQEKVLNRLEDSMITDYKTAYDMATKLGLSSDAADAVAKLVSETSIKKLSDKAIIDVVDKRMTKEQAQKYAEGLGLPAQEVEKIANYAEFINQKVNYNDLPDGYLDYLREQLGKE